MDERKWRPVSLLKVKIDRLEKLIKEKKLPYSNVREFIEEALNDKCKCLNINLNADDSNQEAGSVSSGKTHPYTKEPVPEKEVEK